MNLRASEALRAALRVEVRRLIAGAKQMSEAELRPGERAPVAVISKRNNKRLGVLPPHDKGFESRLLHKLKLAGYGPFIMFRAVSEGTPANLPLDVNGAFEMIKTQFRTMGQQI